MDRELSDQDAVRRADAMHARVGAAQTELFRAIADVDRRRAWRDDGARNMAHWLWMRYGISWWKALRWIAAAHALETLPLISEAFASGRLGIDKVVELTRFATAETEERLVSWAQDVSCGAIRRRGDVAAKASIREARDAERSRKVRWWFDEDSRFGLEAELPAAAGAVVVKALDQLARKLPAMPDEDERWDTEAKTADALVALCSAGIGKDPVPDRVTVIVHARLDGLVSGRGGCEIEGGPVIHPQTVRRLLCNARLQMVVEDSAGQPVGMGRVTREPPEWMVRQLKYRDFGCVFPGCGTRMFTQAHHIRWWRLGGRTDLDNLVLVCWFHHSLVHEMGWRVKRDAEGTVRWFRPDGSGYRAGPAPPVSVRPTDQTILRQPALSAVGF